MGCILLLSVTLSAAVNDVQLVKSSLCESACASVWFDDYPPGATTFVRGRSANATDDCFRLINATCSDCKVDASGVCSHLLFYREPQPISGSFPFCSGYALHTTSSWQVCRHAT